MAKTKKTETALAVKKNTSTDLAAPLEDWEIELAREAKDEVSKETLGIPRLSHQGGMWKIDGKTVTENKLRVAIIDYGFSKAYYENAFDPGVTATPVCYAFGREEKGMAPHDQAPKKQNPECSTCEWNKFGTADRGKGKRCKDERRVLCVVEVADEESIAGAEVRQFNIPPGSLKNWGNYLAQVREGTKRQNVRGVLTELSTEPYGGAYALTFKAVAELADVQVKAIMAKRSSVEAALFAPYPNIEQEEKPAPAPSRKAKGAKF